jgi:NAD(P)-dependent dehydrogenase (short-subunit alcohol dehydrogenase family)
MVGFDGKGVLITGAAGDIGAAVADAFVAGGARVHLTDIDRVRLESRARELGEGFVTTSCGDLAQPTQVDAIVTEAVAALGQVDILVNNAAIQVEGDVEDCPPNLFEMSYAINVRAPFLLSRALVPSMRAAGGGAIVNIASVHATAPGPRRIAYATTKTALLGMTRAMAVDLGRHNVRVNAVSPGATLTDQLRTAWQRHGAEVDVMQHAIAQHPLGRIADVSDVAEAVLYLAGAAFVTGTELRVDGGFLAALRLLPTPAH